MSMSKDKEIFVKFGDYIILYEHTLQGHVASQGFSNPNIFL